MDVHGLGRILKQTAGIESWNRKKKTLKLTGTEEPLLKLTVSFLTLVSSLFSDGRHMIS